MRDYSLAHSWDVSPRAAVAIRDKLRSHLILTWDDRLVRIAAGIDVSYARGARHGYAVVVVMDWTR